MATSAGDDSSDKATPAGPDHGGSGSDERSALERVLGIVTEVRAGEGLTALLLALDVMLLLTAYYIIKPVRKGLILAVPNGAKYESYLGAAIVVGLLFAVPAYASVANRLPKNKLVVGVTLFFASHLVVFFGLSHVPAVTQYLGLLFFVWVGIFNMMVVAQFWAYANDVYTQEQGKRLFALLGLGASIGGVVGAYITPLMKRALGVYPLLLVSGGILVGCAFLTHMVHLRERDRRSKAEVKALDAPVSEAPDHDKAKTKTEGAFGLVWRNKYLLLIGIFSFVYTFVNTNGEFMLSTLVTERAKEAAIASGALTEEAVKKYAEGWGTDFFADFFLWVNILGLAVQTFVVSRIVRFGGLRLAFVIFPIIALSDAVAFLALPAFFAMRQLSVLRIGKIAENCTDYSLNNTVRNMLWLPTTTEMKYKAKQAVDTFFVRMGDVASAAIVYLGADLLGWSVRGFALTNAVLVAIWLYVARRIVVENRRLTEEKEKADDAPALDAHAKAAT